MNVSKQELKSIKKIMKETGALITLREALLLYSFPKIIPKKGQIVEIGSFKGGSSIIIAKGTKKANRGKVFCVDPFKIKGYGNIFPIFLKNLKRNKVENLITPIIKTSEQAVKKFEGKICLLWIDGNHGYKYVKKDFDLWFPKVVDEGFVVFHDVNPQWADVKKFVGGCVIKNKNLKNFRRVDSIVYTQKTSTLSGIETVNNYMFWFNDLIYNSHISLAIDRNIGKVGVFLKRHNSWLYFSLLRLKINRK